MGLFARLRQAAGPRAHSAPTPVSAAPLRASAGSVAAAAVRLDDVAFCVVDVETTGLQPSEDRVVELAVLRCDAHGAVVDEWHTLVNPRRPMDGEWVHGISDEMVAGAPTFEDVAPRLLAGLHGAVLVAHNAAFDRRFVEVELARAGHDLRLPYLCTMHMRRHVGLAAPVMHRLSWACWQAAAPIDQAHAAVADARAVAALLTCYLHEAREAGHETLAPLAATAAAADACCEPLVFVEGRLTADRQLLPRATPAPRPLRIGGGGPKAMAAYQAALADAVQDFVLDGHEVDGLHELVIDLGLGGGEITEAHRDFLRGRLTEYLDDDELSWEEYEQLRVLARLLAVDGRWLEELVAHVRPRHVALTLEAFSDEDLSEADTEEALQAPLSVCFTGPFEAMPLTRAEVEALAIDAGMLVRPGVSAKLDLLVCRDPYTGTNKLRKAEAQGTVVIDQETFLAIAGAAIPTPNPTPAVLNQVAVRRRAHAAAPKRPRRAADSAGTANASIDGQPAMPVHAKAMPMGLADVGDQVLWCEPGAHEWSRPAQRGRPPKRCPEH